MKYLLIISLFLMSLNSKCQNQIDTLELKNFWETTIQTFINKDTNELKQIIHFPLNGDWPNFMGLQEKDSLTQISQFFKNIDKLISNQVTTQLKSQTHKNIEVYNQKDYPTLLVSIDTSTPAGNGELFESAIIFRFKKINNIWKLYVVQGVG